jgi:serine/threonine-protein kinase
MTSAEGNSALKDPLIGRVIQGRYRISCAIGKGGMGVVYEAQHLLIGRKVAVKTLTARASLSSACVLRFRREARAAALVGNSHVVDVLDMGEFDDGSLYIVLEHLDGVHLGWAVAQERRFSASRAVRVLCQLCDALSAVHAAGIVHRDLKPENIFLIERDGEPDFVKVLDFGVCKFKDAEGVSLTATGDTVGTPLFMAPEQVEGRTDIDHRTDIYALGAILYFLLTGRAPFEAMTLPKLFMRICTEPPPSARAADGSVPPGLDAVVQRALSKSPELRFETCAAFRQALLPFSEAAAPPSGIRGSVEMDATVPDATAAVFMGDGPPENDTVGLVQSLKLRRPRFRAVRAVAVVATVAAAVLAAFLTPSAKPVAAPAASARVPNVSAAQTAKPAQEISAPPIDLGEPVGTSRPAAAKASAGPRRKPNAPAPAPAMSASRELPEGSAAASDPPAPAPAPVASASAEFPELGLNRGPKRDL